METVSIRRAVPGDEVALSLVGQAAFLEAFAGVIPGKDIINHCVHLHSVEKYAAWLRDDVSTIWIAEVEPQQAPVAYLVLTRPDLPVPDVGPRDLEVKRIYILHRFQGVRVGARLMEEARAFAQASGVRRLLLGVYSKNEGAIGFYQKLGYQVIGRREFHVGDHTYQDLVLSLSIGN